MKTEQPLTSTSKPSSPPAFKVTPKIASRTPSPLTLPPPAPLNKSQEILDLLFAQTNVNSRFDSRCSSRDYFNGQTFGKVPKYDSVIVKINNPDFPKFRRLKLNDLAGILAEDECSDFRFVVLNIGGTPQLLFSMGAGRIMPGTALSHSMLACGKEEWSECIAAGMIYFQKKDDKWFINKLSNDSGHFRGSIETLISPLILLLEQNEFSFADKVVLELVNRSGSDEVEVSLEHLDLYYQQCALETAILDKQAIMPTQTECVSIAEQSITEGDQTITIPLNDFPPPASVLEQNDIPPYAPVLEQNDIPLYAPVLEQNDIQLLAPVLEQHDTPILSTTLGIFNTPVKRNLPNRDETLETEVTGHQFTPRAKR
ncbi:MAG: hypothetical protein ACRC0M_03960 [Legionella sp.]